MRFGALAEIFDPVTIRHIRELGIGPEWDCWEVGAGGATIPQWLAAQCGPSGSVLATDLDLSWLASEPEPAAGGAFEALIHDIGSDAPPDRQFDLIHARLVLVHVPQRLRALTSMVSCLRPGGWLLIEDADPGLQELTCIDEHGPAQVLANKLRRDFRTLLAGRGAQTDFARTLPRRLRDIGLHDVGADAYFPISAPAATVLERATVQQIGDELISSGLATLGEIEQHLANIDAGPMDFATSPLISAWGRKPVQ